MTVPGSTPIEYRTAHLREQIAADPRVAVLDLVVRVLDDKAFITGTVQTPSQREVAGVLVADAFPGFVVHNELIVSDCPEAPAGTTERLA